MEIVAYAAVAAPARGKRDEDSPNHEELLYRMTQHDDPWAFGYLFRQYYKPLCRQACHIVSCTYRSEEIVSDVLLKLWNNRRQLAINTSLNAYLFAAVRNQAIDYLRHQARHRRLVANIDTAMESGDGSPEDAIIFSEVNRMVERAIDALPPRGRHIFRLSRDRGLKYKEIAELLNISIKTVETHMRRSLIFLRDELGVAR
jgi:RNA polymerase sigma-70 factor (ECF subfamily)